MTKKRAKSTVRYRVFLTYFWRHGCPMYGTPDEYQYSAVECKSMKGVKQALEQAKPYAGYSVERVRTTVIKKWGKQ